MDVKFIVHKNHRILIQDFTGLREIEQGEELIDLCKTMIKKQPHKSVLLLTDVTDAHYNTRAAKTLKQFSVDVTPYVLASAAVGVKGIMKVILQSLTRLSGRMIKAFDTREEAMDWLVEQMESHKKQMFEDS